MGRIVIFGNSGSGKSTLARHLAGKNSLAHFDLDTVAWLPQSTQQSPPQRAPLEISRQQIDPFLSQHSSWVIEGCYGDLIEQILPQATELIFLNLPVEMCLENARRRPWEPHKYSSPAAQERNLEMLLEWIADYENRQDVLSLACHQSLYDRFKGSKQMLTENPILD